MEMLQQEKTNEVMANLPDFDEVESRALSFDEVSSQRQEDRHFEDEKFEKEAQQFTINIGRPLLTSRGLQAGGPRRAQRGRGLHQGQGAQDQTELRGARPKAQTHRRRVHGDRPADEEL